MFKSLNGERVLGGVIILHGRNAPCRGRPLPVKTILDRHCDAVKWTTVSSVGMLLIKCTSHSACSFYLRENNRVNTWVVSVITLKMQVKKLAGTDYPGTDQLTLRNCTFQGDLFVRH